MKKSIASHLFPLSIGKKSLLTVLFPLMALTLASGQVSFGIKAGPSFSNMNYEDGKSLTSFHAGVVVGFKLGSKFSLQPELLYAAKGARFDSGNDDSKMEVQYISLPVMLGYSINALTLKAGPEVNLRMGVNSPLIEIGLVSEDDLFKSTEVSLGVGLAYKFMEKLGAEFRYSFGLTEAGNLEYTDVNGNTVDDNSDGKIQTIQLSVFYLFKG